MDGHQHASLKPQVPAPFPTTAPSWTDAVTRPLSDIREATEPSLIDLAARQSWHQQSWMQPQPQPLPSKASSLKRSDSQRNKGTVRIVETESKTPASRHRRGTTALDGSSSYSSTPEISCNYNVPQSSVPQRSSSKGHARSRQNHCETPLVYREEDSRIVPPIHQNDQVQRPYPRVALASKGQSQSPVKQAGIRLDPVASDVIRKAPLQTIVRTTNPSDILEFPRHRHPRIKVDLHVTAPLFVGGGCVEGSVKVVVEDNERPKIRRMLAIAGISVDLIGFETISDGRRAPFLFLGADLIDADHPPPSVMIDPQQVAIPREHCWRLAPSAASLPFMLSLPLDTGPPPFRSKHANIRFMLSATTKLREAGNHILVRTSRDLYVLSTYDPERALTSLPSPLTASDELQIARASALETLKLNAGIHRQVWVSGSSIFVDVHIANRTRRPIKRLELTLERDVLCYKHAAAKTLEKSAGQARIFDSNEQTILVRASYKRGTDEWSGVEAHASDTRTCELPVPRGHATVKCGKYFEVRYFLNVTASLSNSKLVSVQLPIVLIHMNSLDVLPNSVAQVAAAIDEKRAQQLQQKSRSRVHARTRSQRSVSSPARERALRREPTYTHGRAFAAPRQQSLDRMKREQQDLHDLADMIDSSPRKHQPQLQGLTVKKVGSKISISGSTFGGKNNNSAVPVAAAAASSSTSSIMAAMAYNTPPSNRKARHFGEVGGDERFSSLRARLRRMRSFSSGHSTQSAWTMRSKSRTGRAVMGAGLASRQSHRRPQTALGHYRGGTSISSSSESTNSVDETVRRKENRRHNRTARPTVLLPHVLGLSSSTQNPAPPAPIVAVDGSGINAPPPRPNTGFSFRSRWERSAGFDSHQPRRKVSGSMLKSKGMRLWERAKSRERPKHAEHSFVYSTGSKVDDMGRDLGKERAGWI